MDERHYARAVPVGFADLLDMLLTPTGWLTPFAQIAATRAEERHGSERRRARPAEHVVHFALGHPAVILDTASVEFAFSWLMQGYAIVPSMISGTFTIQALPDGYTSLTVTASTTDRARERIADSAASALLELIASALESDVRAST